MNWKSKAEYDPMTMGVRIAVATPERCLIWENPTSSLRENPQSEPDPKAWVSVDEDAARAMYEALAEYFGGSGNDTRALRRDYTDERARVDKLLAYLTRG